MDMQEINDTLLELENSKTTYPTCEKIAILSMCKKYMEEKDNTNKTQDIVSKQYSQSTSSSEFVKLAQVAPLDKLLDILDEHMEVIRVLYPKEYESVCGRIKAL